MQPIVDEDNDIGFDSTLETTQNVLGETLKFEPAIIIDVLISIGIDESEALVIDTSGQSKYGSVFVDMRIPLTLTERSMMVFS